MAECLTAWPADGQDRGDAHGLLPLPLVSQREL
jgi:hypothetical protein